ncbi:MAG: hypothetical protein IH597_05465 [Bacteroidales bacterium]|nr:hypothetical protein [Bacteroidales bacterium]
MKKAFLHIALILASCQLWAAEVTIIVTSMPGNTPPGDSIFIAGNFNEWNPGNPAYRLQANSNGHPQIVITGSGNIEFKFTRGSWQKVEGNATGGFLPNRTFTFGSADTLFITIQGWEDLGSTNSTAAENVIIMSNDFEMPQLNRTRRIWLYLPPGYDTTTKHYPVLYMHDGQNLFDLYTSFAGEWEVDETLNALHATNREVPIVVGIDNGGVDRLDEYTPWVHPTFGGGDGELYAQFIVETLKPYIDANYRTLPQREHTAVMGSSLGALVSHYICLEYQEVFSRVGVFSPSFWFSDSCYSFTYETGKLHPMRYYMMGGTNESGSLVQQMNDMVDTLLAAGFSTEEVFLKTVPGGQHNELLWRTQFEEAFEWLFPVDNTGTETLDTNPPFAIHVVSRTLHINVIQPEYAGDTVDIKIFSLSGQQVFSTQMNVGSSQLLPANLHGMFLLQVQHAGYISSSKLVLD